MRPRIRPLGTIALLLGVAMLVSGPALVAGILEKTPEPSNIISVEPADSRVIRDDLPVPAPTPSAAPESMTIPAAPGVTAPGEAASPATTPVPAPPGPAAVPDETPLWDALRAQRYDEVLQLTANLQAAYPAWQPPARLLSLVDAGRTGIGIRDAIAAGDNRALLELEASHPQLFSCEHVDWAWAAADAAANGGLPDRLDRLLTRLIPHCRAADRLTTLQKALGWLDATAWEALTLKELPAPRPADIDATFRALQMDGAVRRLQQAAGSQDAALFDTLMPTLADEMERRRDAGTAVLIAWHLLQRNQRAAAAHWFQNARTWDGALTDPPYGLALIALQERRFADARDLARTLPESHPDRARLLGQSLQELAEAARHQGDFATALDLYREAASYSELPRYGRMGWAWASLQTGHEADAAEAFRSLYAESPDPESAQGLLAAYGALGRHGELEALAVSEPLAGLVRAGRAQGAFARKRFLLARALAPEEFGRFGSPAAPRISWHSAWRDKSGDPGLSRLRDSIHGAEAVFAPSPSSEMRLRLDYHILDSGGLDAASRETFARALLVGTGMAEPDDPGFEATLAAAGNSLRVDGTHGHVGGVEPLVTWRRESRFNLEASLGMTLAGGQAPPRAIGRVALGGDTEDGNYTAAAFVRPIRESILSYTGLRLDEFLADTPFTGKRWGAVRGTGIEGNGYRALGKGFSVGGRLAAERVDGRNVRSNDHIAATVNLGYALPVPGMDYAVIGANYSYDHYEHNLSQFTPGHGGYFSPQNFWQAKATLDFQTPENRQALLKGHLDGGRAFKREGATPLIPLDGFEDFGTLPGSRTWGWSWGVELAGALRIGDHVQLGANLSRRESPQYDETAGMLFLRVLFEPRQSVLSTDLTAAVLEGMR